MGAMGALPGVRWTGSATLRRASRRLDRTPRTIALVPGSRSLCLAPGSRPAATGATEREKGWLAADLGARQATLALHYPPGCGTTAAVLVAAHWIQWRDPAATVAFCAADHDLIAGEEGASHLRTAGGMIANDARWLVLLSVRPGASESERGWIETGEALSEPAGEPLWLVRGMRLLPTTARSAPTRRCVWDASAFVARVSVLVAVGRQMYPQLCDTIADIAPFAGPIGEAEPLRRALAAARPSDAFRDLVPLFLPRVAITRLPARTAPAEAEVAAT